MHDTTTQPSAPESARDMLALEQMTGGPTATSAPHERVGISLDPSAVPTHGSARDANTPRCAKGAQDLDLLREGAPREAPRTSLPPRGAKGGGPRLHIYTPHGAPSPQVKAVFMALGSADRSESSRLHPNRSEGRREQHTATRGGAS